MEKKNLLIPYNKWYRNYLIRRYLYGPALKVFCKFIFTFRFAIPMRRFNLIRPIFIVGVSRSGTTAFIDYFRLHRDLCNWSEAAQIMDLNFYNQDIDHYKDENNVTPFEKFRLQFMFGGKTWLCGCARFVNKHPENSWRIKFINEIFSDAIFIHIVRSPEDVINSNYTLTLKDIFRSRWPFGQFPKPALWRSYMHLSLIEQFAHQWVDTVTYIRKVCHEIIGSDRYIEVSYEEFCASPQAILQKLDQFCGLDTDRRLYERIPDCLSSMNGQWQTNLTPSQQIKMQIIIGKKSYKV